MPRPGNATTLKSKLQSTQQAATKPAPVPTPAIPAQVAGYTPTPEQAAILAAVQAGHKVIVIEAGAGAGKTSTLRMIGNVLPGNGQYTAFNTSLVAESKSKFAGTNVACNTTHSLAFRSEGKRFASRLNGSRVRAEVIAEMLGIEAYTLEVTAGDETSERRLAPGFLAGLVMGAIKKFCQSADPAITEKHFKYVDGIDLPSVEGCRTYENNSKVREYLLPFAAKAWADLSNPEGRLPFNHDCYVKTWERSQPVISADYLLIDESQDLSPVMLSVLQQQVDAGISLIFVGDSAQQIYEWRGAINAMAEFPDAPRLILSQSFRFGPAIAQVANAVLETLEEPTALRLKGLESIPSRVEPLADPTAILCRTNAVAVAKLLGAIAAGRKPFLVGGGAEVIAFVRAAKELQNGRGTSHPELACFRSWADVQEYAKLDEGEDLKLIVKLIDTFGAQAIIDGLLAMPKEEHADLIISTAHKAKGREWKKVQLANDFPTKSKCSDADRKLLYVAVTRAQHILDVSQCPFFTGQDALDISFVKNAPLNIAPAAEQPAAVLPETPSVQPANDRQEFSWSKGRDGAWNVRGPAGYTGKTVKVYRRDGSYQEKFLASVIADYPEATVYKV